MWRKRKHQHLSDRQRYRGSSYEEAVRIAEETGDVPCSISAKLHKTIKTIEEEKDLFWYFRTRRELRELRKQRPDDES